MSIYKMYNNLVMAFRLLRLPLRNRESCKRDIATLNSVKYCKSSSVNAEYKQDQVNEPKVEHLDSKFFQKHPIKFCRTWYNMMNEHTRYALRCHKERYIEALTKLPDLPRQGDAKTMWKFDGDPKSLDKWVTTSDSDNNQGYSKAKQELSPDGKLVFSGVLNTKVPKDGQLRNSGYCNISTIPFVTPFFMKEIALNWEGYTHLILRIRGDGRAYIVNIGSKGMVDVLWDDMYSYVLYTRGGPYWQLVTIPFSKFVFAPRGIIQDKDDTVQLHRITSVGITISDKINGPFKLEIDYIGIMRDIKNFEVTAYEQYSHPEILQI